MRVDPLAVCDARCFPVTSTPSVTRPESPVPVPIPRGPEQSLDTSPPSQPRRSLTSEVFINGFIFKPARPDSAVRVSIPPHAQELPPAAKPPSPRPSIPQRSDTALGSHQKRRGRYVGMICVQPGRPRCL